jgi:hypothetical protein
VLSGGPRARKTKAAAPTRHRSETDCRHLAFYQFGRKRCAVEL